MGPVGPTWAGLCIPKHGPVKVKRFKTTLDRVCGRKSCVLHAMLPSSTPSKVHFGRTNTPPTIGQVLCNRAHACLSKRCTIQQDTLNDTFYYGYACQRVSRWLIHSNSFHIMTKQSNDDFCPLCCHRKTMPTSEAFTQNSELGCGSTRTVE